MTKKAYIKLSILRKDRLRRKWYEDEIEEAKWSATIKERKRARQVKNEKTRQDDKEDIDAIYQGDLATGKEKWRLPSTYNDYDEDDEDSVFEWDTSGLSDEDNPPEWYKGYMERMGEKRNAFKKEECGFTELEVAYYKRYGYGDIKPGLVDRELWRRALTFFDDMPPFMRPADMKYLGHLVSPIRHEGTYYIARNDVRYIIARESWLIGYADMAELMSCKRAMDTWYLTQRARFLQQYEIKQSVHTFYAHCLPHTLLEMNLKREAAHIRAQGKGNDLEDMFFTQAELLCRLRWGELRSSLVADRIFIFPPDYEKWKRCWQAICQDIWRGEEFLKKKEGGGFIGDSYIKAYKELFSEMTQSINRSMIQSVRQYE